MVSAPAESHCRQRRLRRQATDRFLEKQARLLRAAFEHCNNTLRLRNGGLSARQHHGRCHRRSAADCRTNRNRRRLSHSEVSCDALPAKGVQASHSDSELIDAGTRVADSGPSVPRIADVAGSWLEPDDFLNLVFRAGLRGDDVEWMGAFDGICQENGQAPVPGIRSSAFVRLVMDDLVRRCQYTSDSLMGMLQLVHGISAQSAQLVPEPNAQPSKEPRSNETWRVPSVELSQIDEVETMSSQSGAKESPRLSVWGWSDERPLPTTEQTGAIADEEANRLERRQKAEAEIAAFHAERQREIKERRERNRAVQQPSGDSSPREANMDVISEDSIPIGSADVEPLQVWKAGDPRVTRNEELMEDEKSRSQACALDLNTEKHEASPKVDTEISSTPQKAHCTELSEKHRDKPPFNIEITGCSLDRVDCIKKVNLDPYPVTQTEPVVSADWENTLSGVFR